MKRGFTSITIALIAALVVTGLLMAGLGGHVPLVLAQVSLASLGAPYTQNFDTLAASGTGNAWTNDTTIEGWYSSRTTYNAGDGSSTTGALYSYGTVAATERALGSLGSGGTGTIYYGVRLHNDTGTVINALKVKYTGEQWRLGQGQTAKHSLGFAYQVSPTITSLTTGSWTDADDLDFTGPISNTSAGAGAALDGNAAANRVTLFATITVTIPAGEEIMLRWMDVNDGGNDHGLGIDDLYITPTASIMLTLTKNVTPTTNVAYHSPVTYTVVLRNQGGISDTNVLFTDTIPISTTFDHWVISPTVGTLGSGNPITWTGTVSNNSAITFTYVAVHNGDYGDVVVNTAEYSGTDSAATATATFTVESLTGNITFVYHDLEDVVHAGEAVYIAGDFNSWGPTATLMASDTNRTVFTATLPSLLAGAYGYKYIVYTDTMHSGPAQWDWLNANNRSYTVAGSATVNDYRDVAVAWANLQWPPAISITLGQNSGNIYGRVRIVNVTDPAGEGRGIASQVGYGADTTPANWDWSPMVFNVDDWLNDEFVGVITPTAGGVYSYVVRYDGNWGAANPNSGWTYADLDSTSNGFSLSQAGVLTTAVYDVGVVKSVTPIVNVPLAGTVTYTLRVVNNGTQAASGVVLTDALPAEAAFAAWVISQTGTTVTDDVVAWSGDLALGQALTWTFSANVSGSSGATVVNTATVEYHGSVQSGDASFQFMYETPSVSINEIRIDQTGADNDEYFELIGPSGASLDGLTYLVIGDGTGGSGVIEVVVDLAGSVIPADGIFLAAETTFITTTTPDLVTTLNFENTDNVTHLLVNGFTGSNNQDLDINDDGVLDVTPWAEMVDLIAVIMEDNPPTSTEYHYGPPTVGPDGTFVPGHVFLCSYGWVVGEFDWNVDDTPGEANNCPAQYDAAIDKTGPVVLLPGMDVTYTIVYSNAGSGDLTGVVITDVLPSGVTYVTDTSGLTRTSTSPVVWEVGTLASGARVSFDLVAHIPAVATGVLTNTAIIGMGEADENTGNNTSDYAAQASTYDLEVSKSVDTAEVWIEDGVGQLVTYTIQINNYSPFTDTTRLTVTDVLPDGFSYVSDDSGVAPTGSGSAGDPLVWVLTDPITRNTGVAFHVLVSATDSIADSGLYQNQVSIVGEPPDDETGNNTAQDSGVYVWRLISPAAARALPNGTPVYVGGYVNFPPGLLFAPTATQDEFAFQDAALGASGLAVFYTGSTAKFDGFGVGEEVRVYGAMGEFNGLRQIAVTDPSHAVATGNDVSLIPWLRLTGEVGEATEGILLRTNGTVTAAAAGYLDIDDGSGVTRVYRDSDTGVSLADYVVGDRVRALGIGWQYDTSSPYDSGYEVHLRFQSDIAKYPQVAGVSPTDGATDVPVSAVVTATFNLDMANVEAATFSLEGPSGAVAGVVSYNAATRTARFTPSALLEFSATYTATLAAELAASNGLTLTGDYVWSFTTQPAVYPQVTDVSPMDGATDVLISAVVTATFNLDMTNVGAATFSLEGPGGAVAGVVSYNAAIRTARFTPSAALAYGATYVATLSADLAAGNGLTLTNDYVWSFTTQLAPPDMSINKTVQTAHTPVLLGDVVTYTIVMQNSGLGPAYAVMMTDSLPLGVQFDQWIQQGSALLPPPANNTIIWGPYAIASHTAYTISFTALVTTAEAFYGDTITNVAEFTSENAGSGSDSAAFTIESGPVCVNITGVVLHAPSGTIYPNQVVTFTANLLPAEASVPYTYTVNGGAPATSSAKPLQFTRVFTSAGSYPVQVAAWNCAMPAPVQSNVVNVTVSPLPQAPDLSTSVKVASTSQQVMPGDLVTYTIILSNTGDADATQVVITDVLGSYYTVYDALDFESAAGALTWSGAVAVDERVTLSFVARVVNMQQLGIGVTTLDNTMTVDDGVNAPFDVSDQTPPWVEIKGIYLPVLMRNG